MCTGPRNPSGSKTLLRSDSSFLFIKFALSVDIITLNLNWSANGCQHNPRDLMIPSSPRSNVKRESFQLLDTFTITNGEFKHHLRNGSFAESRIHVTSFFNPFLDSFPSSTRHCITINDASVVPYVTVTNV